MKSIEDRDEKKRDTLRTSSLPVVNEEEERDIEHIERQLTEMDKTIASGLFQYGNYTSSIRESNMSAQARAPAQESKV